MQHESKSEQVRSLPTGSVIKHVRNKLFRPDNIKTPISQTEFYQICCKIEGNSSPSTKRLFTHVVGDLGRRKIGAIESSDCSDLTSHQLSILARALNMPPNFFLMDYNSLEQIETHYRAITDFKNRNDGFPRIYASDPFPRSRSREIKNIKKAFSTDLQKPAVVFIEGPTSVGKSFFLGQLHKSVLKDTFDNSIYLNCNQFTVDQISSELTRQNYQLSDLASQNPRRRSSQRDVIVLDGLRYDQFIEGPRLPLTVKGRRPSISSLMSVVSQLIRRVDNTSVVVAIENNGGSFPEGRLKDQIGEYAHFHRFHIEPLRKSEAVSFLRNVGASHLPENLAIQFVDYFHGMPMPLVVVAEETQKLTALQVERYIDDLTKGADLEENTLARMSKFVLKYLSRLEENDTHADSNLRDNGRFLHPHAFLRLLALMHGPVSKGQLRDIVRKTNISRIGRFADIDSVAKALPFVIETDNYYDLHGLVRGFLTSELDAIVIDDKFDENISRDELERIHWRSALLNWHVIKNASKTDDITMDAVDAFIHHITKLIALLPPKRRQKKQTPFTEMMISGFESGHDSLTDYALWSLAYEKAAKPFLLDRSFQATRFLGQYHAKARILERLIESVEHGIPLKRIPFAVLCKETALCWMHTGRLLSAGKMLQKGLSSLRRQEPRMHDFFNSVDANSDGRTAERWRLLCDSYSIESIICMREGRQSEDIRSDLDPLVSAAKKIAENTHWKGKGKSEFAPALESGAIRILSRLAELELYAGNVKDAVRQFEVADELQKSIRNRPLDGEAGRKYAVSLLRLAETNSINLSSARDIIEKNVQRMNEFSEKRGLMSNDIVPFWALEIAILRCSQNYELAHIKLDELISHPYFAERQCTFVASLEVELERYRLMIATDRTDGDTITKLDRLGRDCMNSHHHLFANEFRLLMAELTTGREKDSLVREAERIAMTTGHRLRVRDCELLDQGLSAVKMIGV